MSTSSGFRRLIARGQKLYCRFSRSWYHADEMEPYETGGYINRKFNTQIIDNTSGKRSRYRRGPGWQRGLG